MKWVVVFLIGLLGLPGSGRAGLSGEEIEMKVEIFERGPAMLRQLGAWVDMNTGSWNAAGLAAFTPELSAPLVELGFEVERVEIAPRDYPGRGSIQFGPIVRAVRPAKLSPESAPRFLLNGHYDTVFEPDSAFQSLSREPNAARVSGPGAVDMKGGLVVMFEVLRALHHSGDLDRVHWTVLLNGDEEIGSLGSRPAIESAAREADAGFVFESGRSGGAMVRSRRGLGQFFFTVHGVAAHAGSAHADGRSAILDLAQKVAALEALTDYNRGVTVNVGTFDGGTKRNIVPERATAWVDVRYDDPALGTELRREFEELASRSYVEGTTTELWGTLHRPPKPATPQVDRLLESHAEVARDLGMRTPGAEHAGGGTDGSLMAGVGLPTLDSLGPIGAHAHTDRETLEVRSLVERAAVAALLLRRLAREDARAWRRRSPAQ